MAASSFSLSQRPEGQSYFAGVDIGSLTAKAVILNEDEIVAHSLIPVTVSPEKIGRAALEEALKAAQLKLEELKYIVATGYGRISAPYAHSTTSEITCHARGAYFLNPKVRTVVDMGGQDCKAIRVGERGQVVDFAMNDKCAAGTGRFLEVLAKVFDVPLDELGPLCLKAEARVPISSTCTVFAESEVISLMAQGEKLENIISGIHLSIARRVVGILSKIGVEKELIFTGGVGKNLGMRKTLEELLEMEMADLNWDPQLVGALGAALIAKGKATRP